MFSLGVIAYQMLTGQLPYGAQVAKAQNEGAADETALQIPARSTTEPRHPRLDRRGAQEAVHPDPGQRYDELSEFMFDLRHPNEQIRRGRRRAPLMERDPLLFWKGLSAVLFMIVVGLSVWLALRGSRSRTGDRSGR